MAIYIGALVKNLCSHPWSLSFSHISQPTPDQIPSFLSPIYIQNQLQCHHYGPGSYHLLKGLPASTLTSLTSLFLLKHKSNISPTLQWLSSLRTKLKFLIMTLKSLYKLFPSYYSDLTVLICLQGYGLTAIPETHQMCFHYSNFILAIAPPFKALPQIFTNLTSYFHWGISLLTCHFLREVILEIPIE